MTSHSCPAPGAPCGSGPQRTALSPRLRLGLALAAATTVLSGCTSSGPGAQPGADEPVTVARLSGTYVARSGLSGNPPQSVVREAPITLTFTGSTIAVQTGCNSGGGPIRIEDPDVLIADPLTASAMGCAEPLMAQETWVFAMLRRARVEFQGANLALHWGAGGESWQLFERVR